MMNLTQKILASHLVSGQLIPGEEISIRIDQTLTQDSTGTMAYLQFEAMGVKRVRTKRSVAYIDHNTLQTGFENADDHQYIQTVTHKHGIWCSKPGNGICHQVHLERYGIPGWTLLGSDSHTPTGGGIGMLAIGAGGLDVAVAMGGGAYYLTCPRVVNVHLTGKLPYGVAAKDIILEVLRRLSVKGGVGRVMEYTGPGVATLTVPERATIANMGAELGATTSVFPSDEVTRAFLKAQDREADWQPLAADPGAAYDETVEICLDTLVPLVAKPHMPDNVETVEAVGPIAVDQVFIGSCTNSSYQDMMRVARILKGKRVHPNVSLVIGPGSRQVLTMLARNGALADMMAAGARILETACGPCIGMGQSPRTGAVSLRTNNRNFYARSGTASAGIYLVSCETAAASALTGVLTDPRTLGCGPGDPPAGALRGQRQPGHPPGGRRARGRSGSGPRPQHPPLPPGQGPGGHRHGQGAAEDGGQHHHRPHHALQRQAAALPQQYPLPERLLPHPRGPGVPRPGQGGAWGHPGGRAELWPGLQPGARRPGAPVPGHHARWWPSPLPAFTGTTSSTTASCP